MMNIVTKNHKKITTRYAAVRDFVRSLPEDEPILFTEIEAGVEVERRVLITYIDRLVGQGELRRFAKGIYYRAAKGTFGAKPLDANKVIRKKYLGLRRRPQGYIADEQLAQQLGISTQVPRYYVIVTNMNQTPNVYVDKRLNVMTRRPRMKITGANLHYLQLFDLVLYLDKNNYPPRELNAAVREYTKRYRLEPGKIFRYAKKAKCPKVLKIMYEVAC